MRTLKELPDATADCILLGLLITTSFHNESAAGTLQLGRTAAGLIQHVGRMPYTLRGHVLQCDGRV
jgi:hypothetical protein